MINLILNLKNKKHKTLLLRKNYQKNLKVIMKVAKFLIIHQVIIL